MKDFQKRVVEEKAALDEKLTKLVAFLAQGSQLGPEDEAMRRLQSDAMSMYSNVLGMRIARFK